MMQHRKYDVNFEDKSICNKNKDSRKGAEEVSKPVSKIKINVMSAVWRSVSKKSKRK